MSKLDIFLFFTFVKKCVALKHPHHAFSWQWTALI